MQYFSYKTLLHRPLYGFLMLIYIFNFKLFPHFKSARWLQPAIPLLSLVDRLNHAPTCIFAPRKELLLPWSSLLVRCFHGPENPFCFFCFFTDIIFYYFNCKLWTCWISFGPTRTAGGEGSIRSFWRRCGETSCIVGSFPRGQTWANGNYLWYVPVYVTQS